MEITRGGIKLPVRVIAYGVDGIGKTSFAAESDNPIFIPTEDGCNRLDVPQFPLVESWNQLFDNLRQLAKEKHSYKTVVLDSADWAQYLAMEHIVKTDYKGDSSKFDAYGAGYKDLSREWRKLLSAFDYLRKVRNMQVLFLAHAVVKTFKNPAGDDYDQYKATLVDTPSTSIWGMTKEWSDIVLFMNYKVTVKKESAKSAKGKGIMSAGKRVCYSSPNAAWDAKTRVGWTLPNEFELNWDVFKKYISGKKTNPDVEPENEIDTENETLTEKELEHAI